jgi:hypothetical protein
MHQHITRIDHGPAAPDLTAAVSSSTCSCSNRRGSSALATGGEGEPSPVRVPAIQPAMWSEDDDLQGRGAAVILALLVAR